MTDDVKLFVIQALRLPIYGESVYVMSDRLREAAKIIESLSDQLEQVTRERDAAMEDLEMLADCETCIHDDDEACEHCCDCITRGNWQWRGAEVE